MGKILLVVGIICVGLYLHQLPTTDGFEINFPGLGKLVLEFTAINSSQPVPTTTVEDGGSDAVASTGKEGSPRSEQSEGKDEITTVLNKNERLDQEPTPKIEGSDNTASVENQLEDKKAKQDSAEGRKEDLNEKHEKPSEPLVPSAPQSDNNATTVKDSSGGQEDETSSAATTLETKPEVSGGIIPPEDESKANQPDEKIPPYEENYKTPSVKSESMSTSVRPEKNDKPNEDVTPAIEENNSTAPAENGVQDKKTLRDSSEDGHEEPPAEDLNEKQNENPKPLAPSESDRADNSTSTVKDAGTDQDEEPEASRENEEKSKANQPEKKTPAYEKNYEITSSSVRPEKTDKPNEDATPTIEEDNSTASTENSLEDKKTTQDSSVDGNEELPAGDSTEKQKEKPKPLAPPESQADKSASTVKEPDSDKENEPEASDGNEEESKANKPQGKTPSYEENYEMTSVKSHLSSSSARSEKTDKPNEDATPTINGDDSTAPAENKLEDKKTTRDSPEGKNEDPRAEDSNKKQKERPKPLDPSGPEEDNSPSIVKDSGNDQDYEPSSAATTPADSPKANTITPKTSGGNKEEESKGNQPDEKTPSYEKDYETTSVKSKVTQSSVAPATTRKPSSVRNNDAHEPAKTPPPAYMPEDFKEVDSDLWSDVEKPSEEFGEEFDLEPHKIDPSGCLKIDTFRPSLELPQRLLQGMFYRSTQIVNERSSKHGKENLLGSVLLKMQSLFKPQQILDLLDTIPGQIQSILARFNQQKATGIQSVREKLDSVAESVEQKVEQSLSSVKACGDKVKKCMKTIHRVYQPYQAALQKRMGSCVAMIQKITDAHESIINNLTEKSSEFMREVKSCARSNTGGALNLQALLGFGSCTAEMLKGQIETALQPVLKRMVSLGDRLKLKITTSNDCFDRTLHTKALELLQQRLNTASQECLQ